jgi:PAS domain S-box-containing protein
MDGMLREVLVLHVDDEPDVADLTATVLEREDERFTVETATDVATALDRLNDDVDCIVSDYDMPGQTGLDFLEQVRETDPDLPFILYTGKGSEEIASDAISAGATDYLRKRGGTEQYELLANRIRNAVDRYDTERKRRQWRQAVRTANDGIAIISDAGRYVRVNESYAAAYGVSPEEMVGTETGEWYPDEEARRFEEDVRPAVRREGRWEGEAHARRADGTRFEQKLSLTALPDGHVCVMQDITDRRQRERILERRQEKLIRLRDYTQQLMYAESWSEAATVALRAVDEILGFDLGAVFTQSDGSEGVLEIVEALDRPRMEKMYGGLPTFFRDAPSGTHSALAWDVFESGDSVFINDTAKSDALPRRSPFGSLMIYPIGAHGIVLLAATTLDAFTETEELLLDLLANALEAAFDRLVREQELRRQRDRLERQNERLDQFATVVSHDLRNPLNTLSLSLDLVESEDAEDHLARCRRSVDRMDRLIEDLLTLARQGHTDGSFDAVSLADASDACWENVETDGATLVTKTESVVRANRSRVEQLLENLFSNAIDHGGSGVTVTVGDTADGFYVADDGAGIPEDERETVFEFGYSTTDDGTGFGLHIVGQVVESHGWSVSVTESAAGGARFEVAGVETVD